jgi:hypothetical protein
MRRPLLFEIGRIVSCPEYAWLMTRTFSFRKVIVLLTALFLLSSITAALTVLRKSTRSAKASPQLILWAWERPTDLRFIDTKRVGVAFLAKSILLRSDEVLVRPRLQSLQLAAGTRVIAVTRIETDRDHKATLTTQQRDAVSQAIADLASLPNVSEIQIDFDAAKSERTFYRDLIKDVRSRLPAQFRLSITALASWCMFDDWISDLPIDEAIPMLFRMAGDGKDIMTRLAAGDDFKVRSCRQSYGISLDEQNPRLVPSRKLYVFNPDAWTETSARQISESTR